MNSDSNKTQLEQIISELINLLKSNELDTTSYIRTVRKFSRDGNSTFSKDDILKEIDNLIVNSKEYCFLGEAVERNETEGVRSEKLQLLKSTIKLKPMRTESGVTTVTVLTKPYACPGQCIFCPNDVRMPKSYIATEPGAQRALMFKFSPYAQVWNRLKALQNIGHPTDKVEMLILGGTWTSYPESYKLWFTYNLFKAMNDFGDEICDENEMTKQDIKDIFEKDFNDEIRNNVIARNEIQINNSFPWEGVPRSGAEGVNSKHNESKNNNFIEYNKLLQTQEFKTWSETNVIKDNSEITWQMLFEEQDRNSKGKCRCVGLVFETRPDRITEKEVITLRKLGATKVQLGIQILNDEVSQLNKRGENIQDAVKAFELLRKAGFKIHVHMMPNLLSATPEIDLESYKLLVNDPRFQSDEIKIYPTSLIANTELEVEYKAGNWKPYETQELVELIAQMIAETPEYVRLTRIIRDIPSQEIEAGNKLTNLRQVVEKYMQDTGLKDVNIRNREIRNEKVIFDDLELKIIEYRTTVSKEYFLQYVTQDNKVAGFLRLSLPSSFAIPLHGEVSRSDGVGNTKTELEVDYEFPSSEGWPKAGVGYEKSYSIKKIHPYNQNLIPIAKEKRKNLTSYEAAIWSVLKNKNIESFDFHRQKVIGNYIVDFYSPELELVLEIDGKYHDYINDSDMTRQRYLESLGIKVIRIQNQDVVDSWEFLDTWLSGICKERFLELTHPGASHHPSKEGNLSAMIREIHVYGPSLELSKDSLGDAQHLGLGTKLIQKAKEITKENGYNSLKVISAIGTREYYAKRGFGMTEDGLYQETRI